MPNSGLPFFKLFFQDYRDCTALPYNYTVDDHMVIGLVIDSPPAANIMNVFHCCSYSHHIVHILVYIENSKVLLFHFRQIK